MDSSNDCQDNSNAGYNGFSKLSNANQRNNQQQTGSNSRGQKAQVFSTYVQGNESNKNVLHKNQNANKYNFQHRNAATDRNAEPFDPIKKPKLSSLIATTKENSISPSEADLLNDSFVSMFVGVQSFAASANNMFTDFIDSDLVLVSLDTRPQFKSKFCFKGKCKLSLVYGQINVNGFDLKSPKLFDGASCNGGPKSYELYSAETNSFLSISTSVSNDASSSSLDENQSDMLIRQIIQNYNLNGVDTSVYLKFKDFLRENQFSAETSSLFVLHALKSHMCSYLSYFENFHHVYESSAGVIAHQDLDSKLAKLGVFPVESQNFNAIKIETNEEKQIASEVSNSQDS